MKAARNEIPETRKSRHLSEELHRTHLTVGWAGEALCTPPRLGWWRTDRVDAEGGGDLFTRLLPRTAPWAALEAARAAAANVDRSARLRLAQPDAVRTLFARGFSVDEKLAERRAHHKRSLVPVSEALSLPIDPSRPFTREGFEAALKMDQ